MKSNPYQIGLLAVGGFSAVIAFMLWVVHGEVTDYSTWDVEVAGSLMFWTGLLIQVFVTCAVGAAVIHGVAWSLRRSGPTTEHPAPGSEYDHRDRVATEPVRSLADVARQPDDVGL